MLGGRLQADIEFSVASSVTIAKATSSTDAICTLETYDNNGFSVPVLHVASNHHAGFGEVGRFSPIQSNLAFHVQANIGSWSPKLIHFSWREDDWVKATDLVKDYNKSWRLLDIRIPFRPLEQ